MKPSGRIVIIGAGPAGSIAAISLARAGHQVTLIEQHRFPRDKVCGECLSSLGLATLADLDLTATLKSLQPVPLKRSTLISMDGRSATVDLPAPMWGLSRHAMDGALLETARACGAAILQPARVESISPDAVSVRDLQTNQITQLDHDWIILADGKGAFLNHRPKPSGDLGLKAHFTNVDSPRDCITLFGAIGHYVGLAPIENDRWNIAFSIPAKRVEAHRGNLPALWAEILSHNPVIRHAFAKAQLSGDWLAAPLPRFAVTKKWPERMIPIGNAAAALEPIGGEGMGLAMRSALLAARALHQSITTQTPLPINQLQRQFSNLWQLRRVSCRALARLLANPALCGGIIDWAAASDSTAQTMLNFMGKKPASLIS